MSSLEPQPPASLPSPPLPPPDAMSNLRSILNPQDTPEPHVKVEDSGSYLSSPQSVSSSPSSTPLRDVARQRLRASSTADHPPHPNCPDTLDCLPDTDGRPQHTLPVILRCAILGSPKQRLTIRDIYAAMEEKYPYYRTAGLTWKQSVRHHLSLNRLFEREPRPAYDPGFGSYWTVNLSAPPGTKRPRKRGRQNKAAAAAASSPPDNSRDMQATTSSAPRDLSTADIQHPPIATLTPQGAAKRRSDNTYSDVEDEIMDDEDIGADGFYPVSDEDPYDNELMPMTSNHYAPSSSSHRLDHQPSLSFPPPPVPTVSISNPNDHQSNDLFERLVSEVVGLRRQSALSHSISQRMTEQLARVTSEKQALEKKLESERARRIEAEATLESIRMSDAMYMSDD